MRFIPPALTNQITVFVTTMYRLHHEVVELLRKYLSNRSELISSKFLYIVHVDIVQISVEAQKFYYHCLHDIMLHLNVWPLYTNTYRVSASIFNINVTNYVHVAHNCNY